jgi:hypothetical protein
MNFKCGKCGGTLPLDMTKECPTCFPVVSPEGVEALRRAGLLAEPVDSIYRGAPYEGPSGMPGVDSEILERRRAMSSNVVGSEAEFVAKNLGEAVIAWFRKRPWLITPADAAPPERAVEGRSPPPLAE